VSLKILLPPFFSSYYVSHFTRFIKDEYFNKSAKYYVIELESYDSHNDQGDFIGC